MSNSEPNMLKWQHPLSLFCTWFCSGLVRKAPGTFGTLAALPFAWAIQYLLGANALLIAAIIAFVAGIFASDAYMRRAGTGHDPKQIVIDEVAGMWLVLVSIPAAPFTYALAFILFRFFDIMKPWPISLADRKVHGGFGVMLDDLLAAVFAIICYHFIVIVFFTQYASV